MIKFQYALIISFAALTYCVWNSMDLFQAWNQGVYEYYGWILLGIWVLPFFYWSYKTRFFLLPNSMPNQIILGFAILITLIGQIGVLHILNNIALVMAISAFMPFFMATVVWCGAGIAWVPQVSWVLIHAVPTYKSWYFIIRFVIVTLGSVWLLIKLKKYPII